MDAEALGVLAEVAAVLESLGVPYAVGGSVASSIHGTARTTMDADVVADLRPEHVRRLASTLSGAYYLDEAAGVDAIRRRSSFNLVHRGTSFKVDLFVLGTRPYDREALGRRRRVPLGVGPGQEPFVLSAEDTLLGKLEWYRKGGELSERQWKDVLGILRTQGVALDGRYLARWAREIGVGDLLERAQAEAAG